jgi:hypothetical protein
MSLQTEKNLVLLIINIKFSSLLYMTKLLLIVLMSALGIGLALTPTTSGMNPGL